MEAANDYITQSIGVLSKHGRSLKGIRRVEVFDKLLPSASRIIIIILLADGNSIFFNNSIFYSVSHSIFYSNQFAMSIPRAYPASSNH